MKILLVDNSSDAQQKWIEPLRRMGIGFIRAKTTEDAAKMIGFHSRNLDALIVHEKDVAWAETLAHPFFVTTMNWGEREILKHQNSERSALGYFARSVSASELNVLLNAKFAKPNQVLKATGTDSASAPSSLSLESFGDVLSKPEKTSTNATESSIRLQPPSVLFGGEGTKSNFNTLPNLSAKPAAPATPVTPAAEAPRAGTLPLEPVEATLIRMEPAPKLQSVPNQDTHSMSIPMQATGTESAPASGGENASSQTRTIILDADESNHEPMEFEKTSVAMTSALNERPGATLDLGIEEEPAAAHEHEHEHDLEASEIVEGYVPPPDTSFEQLPEVEEANFDIHGDAPTTVQPYPAPDPQRRYQDQGQTTVYQAQPRYQQAEQPMYEPQPLPVTGQSSTDVETLKSYLALREQDVAVLTGQVRSSQERLQQLDAQLRIERARSAELQHMVQKQENQIKGYDQEKQVDIEVLYKQVEDLNLQLKERTEKVRTIEGKLKLTIGEVDKMKERVRTDIRRIRVREKELEGQLEILKKDSAALLMARDEKILELKRKLDLLEFNMELVQEQYAKERHLSDHLKGKLKHAASAMREAGGFLDVEGA